MTGIPTVSDLAAFIYETLVFCCLTGFAAYDIRTRRVPDRALVFFCPAVLASLPVHMQGTGASFQASLGFSLAGCAAGFLILLTAALLSACAALITLCRLRGKAKRLSLPFVPFIAAGSLITLIISMT